ncbi:MAG: hypothetical protein ACJ72A_08635, partial [Nocardioidaceae bacterium]
MPLRDLPPFRADHVGSLLRPPRLLQARTDHAEGRIDAAELREVEDEAIREVVRMQEDLGLQTATDGEFRRTSWHMDFIYQLEGIHRTDEQIEVHFHNADGDLDFTSAALAVDGRIGLSHTIFGQDFEFLQSATDGEFRRTSWHMDFIYSLGGVGQTDGRITVRMHNADGDVEFTAPALQINGPIRLTEPIFGADFSFLR